MIFNTQHLYTHMKPINKEITNVPLSVIVSIVTSKGAGYKSF